MTRLPIQTKSYYDSKTPELARQFSDMMDSARSIKVKYLEHKVSESPMFSEGVYLVLVDN